MSGSAAGTGPGSGSRRSTASGEAMGAADARRDTSGKVRKR